jgi:hypothetical protein
VEKLALREEEVLSSVVRLSTVFSDKLDDEHVHIIVDPAHVSEGKCQQWQWLRADFFQGYIISDLTR